jgi:hypothetical protein
VQAEFSGFSGADINMRCRTYPFQKKAPLSPGYWLVGRCVLTAPTARDFSAVAWSGRRFKSTLSKHFSTCSRLASFLFRKAVFPLENIQEAHREWGKASGTGSVVIKVQK